MTWVVTCFGCSLLSLFWHRWLVPCVTLLHHPRMDTEQIGSKVYEQRSVVAASSDATSSGNRTFLTPAACSATPAGSPSSSFHPETASPGPTCSAEAGPVLVGGDPRTDPMCMVSSSPLWRGLASQTAKSPASVSPSPASKLGKSTGLVVRDAWTVFSTADKTRDGSLVNSAAEALKPLESELTGSGRAGDALTELATPNNFDKNSRGCSEVSVRAVDGHCMSADQPGQYTQRFDTRVNGRPISLSDRILEKRYSSSSRAGGKVDEHRDGRRSQAVSANSKMVRRRDGSVGQEGADGSAVCAVMSTQGCDVVGQSLSPPATATATAPLDGLTIFPTYTPSTTAVSYSDTCQEHSTARAAQTTPRSTLRHLPSVRSTYQEGQKKAVSLRERIVELSVECPGPTASRWMLQLQRIEERTHS